MAQWNGELFSPVISLILYQSVYHHPVTQTLCALTARDPLSQWVIPPVVFVFVLSPGSLSQIKSLNQDVVKPCAHNLFTYVSNLFLSVLVELIGLYLMGKALIYI